VTTQKVPVAEKQERKFDFSGVNPRDWECFGHIEPGHPECKGCHFKVECAAESEKNKK